ncbi:MAG: glycosyl hydrolase [Armatimonadota bacterium]|nr:glycosyl hydrolase [Armatimonadota bacterium]MCX7778446.1 glycosyl hydrolase [Armatimonadota bacterium]MDW8026034.1 glycosyl hydrolase [Armatimonadota bacterium]
MKFRKYVLLTGAVILLINYIAVLCKNAKQIYEPVNPNLSLAAREVFSYLKQIYGKQVLSGYNVYPHTPDDFQQTGRHGAVWGRDLRWLGNPHEVVQHAIRYGYILTIHWHWFFDGDSAWKRERKKPVDVGRVVTPGTSEYQQLMKELAEAADKLEVLKNANVPVLWRPLHEIDGGWFWWTDTNQPENTAELWRIMFNYFTNKRQLNNLIWVYSTGVGDRKKKPVEYRRRFYPGSNYVDIIGIDIYGVDVRGDDERYLDYFKMMSEIDPNKMIALTECDDIPNPDKIRGKYTPVWLYALPWWGCPHPRRTVEWANFTMSHDLVITLEELPAFSWAKTSPHIGLFSPRDDGSAWFTSGPVNIEGYGIDRDGKVERVEFFANEMQIGAINNLLGKNFSFVWENPPAGCYTITAVAYDNEGNRSTSNSVRIGVKMVNIAKGKKVQASSGEHPELAVDGNYYTSWKSEKSDEEWLIVDLGQLVRIDKVNLLWGWKIHAADFTIDVAESAPENPKSWRTVYSQSNLPWVTWKATYRIQFSPIFARYVRVFAKKRPRGQTWGGYDLAEIEIPVPIK